MLITTKANIASVSAIGFSRREGSIGLLPESPSHPRSGKSSTAQLPQDPTVQLVFVSRSSHELGPLAPFHLRSPRAKLTRYVSIHPRL